MKIKSKITSPYPLQRGTKNIPLTPLIRGTGTVLLIGYLVSFSTFALFAQTLSLDSILSRIERNNPLLLSYQYKANAVDELVKGAKNWNAPIVESGFNQTPYIFKGGGSFVVTAEQDIPNPKKLQAKEDYLKSLSVLEKNEASFTKNDLFAWAKKAYYARYISERKIKIIEENIHLINFIIELSSSQIANGKSDLQSVYKAQAELYTLEAMKAHEQGLIQQANVQLNYFMNQTSQTNFEIDSNIELENYLTQLMDTSNSFIQKNRSDIQKLDNTINALKLNKNLAVSQLKPDFGVKVEHYSSFASSWQFSLMGKISFPMAAWSSKELKAMAASTDIQIQAVEQEKINAINSANQQLNMAIAELKSEYVEVDDYKNKVIPTLKKNFEVNLLAYQQNTNDLYMTLMAWKDFQAAQTDYLYHL